MQRQDCLLCPRSWIGTASDVRLLHQGPDRPKSTCTSLLHAAHDWDGPSSLEQHPDHATLVWRIRDRAKGCEPPQASIATRHGTRLATCSRNFARREPQKGDALARLRRDFDAVGKKVTGPHPAPTIRSVSLHLGPSGLPVKRHRSIPPTWHFDARRRPRGCTSNPRAVRSPGSRRRPFHFADWLAHDQGLRSRTGPAARRASRSRPASRSGSC